MDFGFSPVSGTGSSNGAVTLDASTFSNIGLPNETIDETKDKAFTTKDFFKTSKAEDIAKQFQSDYIKPGTIGKDQLLSNWMKYASQIPDPKKRAEATNLVMKNTSATKEFHEFSKDAKYKGQILQAASALKLQYASASGSASSSSSTSGASSSTKGLVKNINDNRPTGTGKHSDYAWKQIESEITKNPALKDKPDERIALLKELKSNSAFVKKYGLSDRLDAQIIIQEQEVTKSKLEKKLNAATPKAIKNTEKDVKNAKNDLKLKKATVEKVENDIKAKQSDVENLKSVYHDMHRHEVHRLKEEAKSNGNVKKAQDEAKTDRARLSQLSDKQLKQEFISIKKKLESGGKYNPEYQDAYLDALLLEKDGFADKIRKDPNLKLALEKDLLSPFNKSISSRKDTWDDTLFLQGTIKGRDFDTMLNDGKLDKVSNVRVLNSDGEYENKPLWQHLNDRKLSDPARGGHLITDASRLKEEIDYLNGEIKKDNTQLIPARTAKKIAEDRLNQANNKLSKLKDTAANGPSKKAALEAKIKEAKNLFNQGRYEEVIEGAKTPEQKAQSKLETRNAEAYQMYLDNKTAYDKYGLAHYKEAGSVWGRKNLVPAIKSGDPAEVQRIIDEKMKTIPITAVLDDNGKPLKDDKGRIIYDTSNRQVFLKAAYKDVTTSSDIAKDVWKYTLGTPLSWMGIGKGEGGDDAADLTNGSEKAVVAQNKALASWGFQIASGGKRDTMLLRGDGNKAFTASGSNYFKDTGRDGDGIENPDVLDSRITSALEAERLAAEQARAEGEANFARKVEGMSTLTKGLNSLASAGVNGFSAFRGGTVQPGQPGNPAAQLVSQGGNRGISRFNVSGFGSINSFSRFRNTNRSLTGSSRARTQANENTDELKAEQKKLENRKNRIADKGKSRQNPGGNPRK